MAGQLPESGTYTRGDMVSRAKKKRNTIVKWFIVTLKNTKRNSHLFVIRDNRAGDDRWRGRGKFFLHFFYICIAQWEGITSITLAFHSSIFLSKFCKKMAISGYTSQLFYMKCKGSGVGVNFWPIWKGGTLLFLSSHWSRFKKNNSPLHLPPTLHLTSQTPCLPRTLSWCF